jgi:hypothetical protein
MAARPPPLDVFKMAANEERSGEKLHKGAPSAALRPVFFLKPDHFSGNPNGTDSAGLKSAERLL